MFCARRSSNNTNLQRYCSHDCEIDARATYHRFECMHSPMMPAGQDEEEMKEIIALRMIVMTPLQELHEFMPRFSSTTIDADSWSAVNVGKWGTRSAQEKIGKSRIARSFPAADELISGRNVRSFLSLYGHGEATRQVSSTTSACLMEMVKFLVGSLFDQLHADSCNRSETLAANLASAFPTL